MNRSEFINEVAKRKGISVQQAYRYVTDTMDTLRVVLSKGEKVEMGGFGRFFVVTDLTGSSISVFTAGRALSRAVNDSLPDEK